jgi:hypothetical protein
LRDEWEIVDEPGVMGRLRRKKLTAACRVPDLGVPGPGPGKHLVDKGDSHRVRCRVT